VNQNFNSIMINLRVVTICLRLLSSIALALEIAILPATADPAFARTGIIGGSKDERVTAVATDPQGNLYFTGVTRSADFPVTAGALQTTYGPASQMAFVVKIGPQGNVLYATYLGGTGSSTSNSQEANGIVADAEGNAYVAGWTQSTNFPTTVGAYQPKPANPGGAADAFLVKLNPTGTALVYGTLLGGRIDEEKANAVAIDSLGNAYIGGTARARDFPVVNAFQAIKPNSDSFTAGFVAKFDPSGSSLLFSTFLGGNRNDDRVNALAVDAAGAVYATGSTRATNFPVLKPFQAKLLGSQNAFVTKFNPEGNTLAFSTYLASSGGSAIAVDSAGAVYVTGTAGSTDFPVTPGALKSTPTGFSDATVTKFSADGSTLLYSTFVGGSGSDSALRGLALDSDGNAYVSGQTRSTDFPLVNPLQATYGGGTFGGDGVVFVLNATGTALRFSTYLGGGGDDSADKLALLGSGEILVGLTSDSPGFLPPRSPRPNPKKIILHSGAGGNDGTYCVITGVGSPGVIANPITTTANTPNVAHAGDPISTFTGELANQLPADLDLGGPMPLRFARYYASMLKREGLVAGRLGDNWLHNFEWSLTTTPSNTVRVVNHQGRRLEFTNTAGGLVLVGLQETPFQLVASGGNYVLGDPRSQRLYTFDSSGKLTQIEDGHGNAHTLTYAGGNLASVSDGLGRTLTFSYDAGGALTSVSDGTRSVAFTQGGNNLASVASPLGFTTVYTYDTGNTASGLLSATIRPAGNVPWAQVFDAQGRVVSQTDGGVHTATIAYAGNVTTFTNPRSDVQRDTHTADGDHVSFEDETGHKIALGYNGARQRNLVTDRLGDTIGIAYHAPSGQPATITNADGTSSAFTYVARTVAGVTFHDVAQTTFPDGTSEQFTYDANGNVLSRTDRAGKVWSFTYNSRGQVLTALNPTGGTTTYTYDAAGNLASRRDSDTGTTTYAYDMFSRLTKTTHPDGATAQMAYDDGDRLTSATDERGNTTSFTYDNNGNVVRITDALGNATGFAYDARDRMIRSTNRLGQVSSRAFGPLDQLVAVTNRNGHVTTFGYDARRRLTATTDPGGKTWSLGYDEEDILIAATNPLGQTSTSGTDRLGYPVTATNALGHVTRVVRDTLRRVTATVDGINRTNRFGYDARGLLASATKPVIGTANYERDALGQLARITDLNGSQWDFSHTPMGREAGRTDPLNRAQTTAYDSRGRPLRTVFPDGVTATNFYDPAGNLIRRAYSDGTDYQFAYDALNRLVSANGLAFAYDAEGRLTNTVSSGADYAATYDAGGRLTSVGYHNGAFTVNYAYDSRDRLVRVTDTLTGTQRDFAYDDAGRMTALTRPNGVNGAYTYDAAGRLTRIQEGSIVDLQFTFDAAQQITSVNHTAPLDPAALIAPTAQTHAYDAAHQISTPGHAYDARGRQTASPGHSFQWDGASRLRQIDGVTLAYDGADNLQTRTAGGTTVRYFYHHAIGLAPIMAERNETVGQMQRFYVWTPGGRLLYAIDPAKGNAVSHYHFDQVGSTLALTAANGAVTDAYAYTPYGVLLGRTGTSTQPFTYVGAYGVRAEPVANLSHMRARYFHPASARFLSRDSRNPQLAEIQTLNPYDYAERNPLSFVDPEGTSAYLDLDRAREEVRETSTRGWIREEAERYQRRERKIAELKREREERGRLNPDTVGGYTSLTIVAALLSPTADPLTALDMRLLESGGAPVREEVGMRVFKEAWLEKSPTRNDQNPPVKPKPVPAPAPVFDAFPVVGDEPAVLSNRNKPVDEVM
jgi:RHS repeat-associated protein